MKYLREFSIVTVFVILFSMGSVSLCLAGGKKKEGRVESEQEGEVQPLVPSPEEKLRPEERAPVLGTLRGRVLDDERNPLSGIEVKCLDKDGNIVARAVTDEEGRYEFQHLVIGEYTLQATLSGFAPTLSARHEEKIEPPPAPTGLRLYETVGDNPSSSTLRVRWDVMPDVQSYRCELYQEEEEDPLSLYQDIQQSSAEFGNLREDTEYRIRVYSKNSAGYSESYAHGTIRTKKKPPFSPFGLVVLNAKDHRVDLKWSGFPTASLKGYGMQIKKENGSYLYFSEKGLTPDKNQMLVIEGNKSEPLTYTIDTVLQDGTPLLDNGIPYSFRVFALDRDGQLSKPSNPVEGVMLQDTVPPRSPHDIEYTFIAPDRIRMSWKSEDRDIEKYRIYYGIERDEWDEVADTEKTSHEVTVDREGPKPERLFVAITAVDRAGNESSYLPLVRKTRLDEKGEVIEELFFSEKNVYGAFSIALEGLYKLEKIATQKKKVEKIVQPREYGFSFLMKKGFVVKKGETATINGAVKVPENRLILVEAGGTLNVKNAKISSQSGRWGGIRYLGNSSGYVHNTVISNAVTAIAVVNNSKGIGLRDVEVFGSPKAGIQIKNSKVSLSSLLLKDNEIGLFIENGEVRILSSLFEGNRKGVLAHDSATRIVKSRFVNNQVYGVRLYGGGVVEETTIEANVTGVLLEEGRGSSLIINSRIEKNLLDGVIVSTSNSEIKRSLISANGRHGIYVRNGANPPILEDDIVNNSLYAVFGGGKVERCFVYANNGSLYVDDTGEKGRPDNVCTSSSTTKIKQIYKVDHIKDLSLSPVLQQ